MLTKKLSLFLSIYLKLEIFYCQTTENIVDNPYITQQQMADKLQVNRKTIQRGLNSLKEKNIIERIGSDRKGSWRIL